MCLIIEIEEYLMNSDSKTFEEFFKEEYIPGQKFYCSFQGIKRKDYPKWLGWSYIDNLKGTVSVQNINTEIIDLLVQNFFIVKYLNVTLGFSESR